MLFKISRLHSAFNWRDMMVMLWWMWKHGCYMLTTFSIVSKEYKQTRHSCQKSNSNWGFNSYNFAFDIGLVWMKFRQFFVTSFLLVVIDRLCGFLRTAASARFTPLPLSVVGFIPMTRGPIPSFVAIHPVWDCIISTFFVEHTFVNPKTINELSRVVLSVWTKDSAWNTFLLKYWFHGRQQRAMTSQLRLCFAVWQKRAQAARRPVMTLLCFNIAIFLAKLLGAEQVRNLGSASLVLLRNPFDIHSIVLFCSEVRKTVRLVTHRKKGNR